MPVVIYVPVKLDAFVFNRSVFEGESRVVPITQPDYSALGADAQGAAPRSDVLPFLDLSATSPPEVNTRITDVTSNQQRNNRFGIYLSWCIPKPFRRGYAATASAKDRVAGERQKAGLPDASAHDSQLNREIDSSVPEFVAVPNRWLVVRQSSNLAEHQSLPRGDTKVFLVENDRVRHISDFSPSTDVESTAAPFINPNLPLHQQSECFLGWSTEKLDEYTKDKQSATSPERHSPLTVMSAANPYFADYQPHHSNVFSVHDDLSDFGRFSSYLKVSYLVIGYYSHDSKIYRTNLDPIAIHYQSRVSKSERFGAEELLQPFAMTRAIPASAEEHNERFRDFGIYDEDVFKGSQQFPDKPPPSTICHGSLYDVEFSYDQRPRLWPAELAMELLSKSHPVALGTTTIDAFVSLAKAAKDGLSDGQQKTIAATLLRKAEAFLLNADDSVDSQLLASDLVPQNNFNPLLGGKSWHLKKKDGSTSSQVVPPESRNRLYTINTYQAMINDADRELQFLQHCVFCTWWKFSTCRNSEGKLDARIQQEIVSNLQIYSSLISNLTSAIAGVQDLMKPLLSGFDCEAAADLPFYTQKDPVVGFAGLRTGWPSGYDEDLPVRLRDVDSWQMPSNFLFEFADRSYILDKLSEAARKADMVDFNINMHLTPEQEHTSCAVCQGPLISQHFDRMTEIVRGISVYKLMGQPVLHRQYEIDKLRIHFELIQIKILIGVATHSVPYDAIPKVLLPLLQAKIRCQLLNMRLDIDLQLVNMLRQGSPFDPTCKILHDALSRLPLDKYGNLGLSFPGGGELFNLMGSHMPEAFKQLLADQDPADVQKRLPAITDSKIQQWLHELSRVENVTVLEDCVKDLLTEWTYNKSLQDMGRTTHAYYLEHDHWLGQAWFPIFVEWEIEYFHIPWKYWSFQPCGPEKRVRWTINSSNLSAEQSIKDNVCVISGRSYVLPQVAAQLKTMIDGLVKSLTPEESKQVTPEQMVLFRKALNNLPYMSAQLEGLTDHLTTLMSGNHVKPSFRPAGSKLHPVKDLSTEMKSLGFTETLVDFIGSQTDRTPFASHETVSKKWSSSFALFKPVTHGQFRFTKLNIVDKFGQVVPCLYPDHLVKGDKFRPLYPCSSEYMSCSPREAGADGQVHANTVIEDEPGLCQFVQIPPKINQPSRWNAKYMTAGSAMDRWRSLNEWENPMWGVLVLNYVNRTLQVFTGEGDFVAEYAVGGPSGLGAGERSGPYTHKTQKTPLNWQLSEFKKALDKDSKYIKAVYTMIEQAIGNLPHAPSSYASALPAIFGRPIALVNMGWSLELSHPPLHSQADQDPAPDMKLEDYEFPLKLGDKDASYDGLIGYVHPNDLGSFIWDKISTSFKPTDNSDAFPSLQENNHITFKPYFRSVEKAFTSPVPVPGAVSTHDERLKCFASFVDAFTPVHGYSGILPLKQLQLPRWAVDAALQKMEGFFAVGPLLVPDDVLPLDVQPREQRSVQLPSAGVGSWEWLQPYVTPVDGDHVSGGEAEEKNTPYETMGLGHIDRGFGMREGPFSAIEGFMRLKKEEPK